MGAKISSSNLNVKSYKNTTNRIVEETDKQVYDRALRLQQEAIDLEKRARNIERTINNLSKRDERLPRYQASFNVAKQEAIQKAKQALAAMEESNKRVIASKQGNQIKERLYYYVQNVPASVSITNISLTPPKQSPSSPAKEAPPVPAPAVPVLSNQQVANEKALNDLSKAYRNANYYQEEALDFKTDIESLNAKLQNERVQNVRDKYSKELEQLKKSFQESSQNAHNAAKNFADAMTTVGELDILDKIPKNITKKDFYFEDPNKIGLLNIKAPQVTEAEKEAARNDATAKHASAKFKQSEILDIKKQIISLNEKFLIEKKMHENNDKLNTMKTIIAKHKSIKNTLVTSFNSTAKDAYDKAKESVASLKRAYELNVLPDSIKIPDGTKPENIESFFKSQYEIIEYVDNPKSDKTFLEDVTVEKKSSPVAVAIPQTTPLTAPSSSPVVAPVTSPVTSPVAAAQTTPPPAPQSSPEQKPPAPATPPPPKQPREKRNIQATEDEKDDARDNAIEAFRDATRSQIEVFGIINKIKDLNNKFKLDIQNENNQKLNILKPIIAKYTADKQALISQLNAAVPPAYQEAKTSYEAMIKAYDMDALPRLKFVNDITPENVEDILRSQHKVLDYMENPNTDKSFLDDSLLVEAQGILTKRSELVAQNKLDNTPRRILERLVEADREAKEMEKITRPLKDEYDIEYRGMSRDEKNNSKPYKKFIVKLRKAFEDGLMKEAKAIGLMKKAKKLYLTIPREVLDSDEKYYHIGFCAEDDNMDRYASWCKGSDVLLGGRKTRRLLKRVSRLTGVTIKNKRQRQPKKRVSKRKNIVQRRRNTKRR